MIAERGLRDRAVITTKFTYNAEPGNPNAGGNGRKNILRAVEGSLKRLGTEYIDLYLLHTWDMLTPAEEVMRTLDDLVRSGKVRHVGLSNVPAWYASRAQAIAEHRGYEPVTALQLEYSLAERNIEHEFVPFGISQGAGIMVWSPLASGLLSGKYRPGKEGNAGRLDTMRGVEQSRLPEIQRAQLGHCRRTRKGGGRAWPRHGASRAQLGGDATGRRVDQSSAPQSWISSRTI